MRDSDDRPPGEPSSEANPFERWDIDPSRGPSAITERMRELIEDAPDEETRRAIRAAWEELTMHPQRRYAAALGAHPDSHHLSELRAPPPIAPLARELDVDAVDLSDRASLLDRFDLRDAAHAELPDADPADDPFLR
ncbi:MAG: hypothetical protein AB7S26_28325 [Sandaracinaceae bacterium]